MVDKKPERKQECVQVVVRCRPFSTKETKENRGNIIAMETALFQISLSNPSRTDQEPKNFTFDAVYDETTQQKAFYEESCYDLVEGVMEGYNGTIFAYGQTGCGKTHTMQGYSDPPELRGVIPHSFDHIFENIKGSVNTAFLVRCCYLEIYNEEVRDLLATNGEKKEKLELKEDPNKGVYIKDLTQAVVRDQEGINRLMDQGHKMRTVGATAMNETSSRSHSIFTIVIEINQMDEAGKDHIRVGKLNLVDLAGSERASKTGATGDRLKEGCKINLSLSALGNVISALVDGKGKHIPYRDSKLTRLLQDSLGGNTKTLMVAAISPADYNYEETLSTLRYANRAKNIKNKPKINEDPKDTMLRQYKEEIEMLRQQLAKASLEANDSSGGAGVSRAPNTANENAPQPLSDERDSQSRTPLTVDRVVTEGTTMSTPDASKAAGLAEGVDAGGPGPAAVGEQEESAGRGEEAIADGGHRRSHESPKEERQEEMKGSHTASLEAPPAPEVREKIVERVVVEEKVVVKEVEVEVEVESQQMAGQRQALENYSRAVEEQRNRLGQELETSVIRADVERQAREEIAKKLDALQTKVIGLSSKSEDRRQGRRRSMATGGSSKKNEGVDKGRVTSPVTPPGMDDPEVIIARRNAEHRRMQAKLRQKRKREAQLELERVRALEEKAEVEKEMADMVGQAEEKERRLNKSRKKLEKKLEAAREEIDDLAMEHEAEREELLDSIRNQNKELQLWEQVARQILPSKEIARIWERGEYNEDEQTWVLPRIKPRASYAGEPCKLPLLGPAGAVIGGGGIDDDVSSQVSSGGGSRRDRRRGGGRNGGVEIRGSGSGGAMEGGGSGRRASVGGRSGKADTASGGEEGGGKRRRSVVGGRGGTEDRPPRRAGEGVGPREGGGGMFNGVDKPWEGFAGRETGKSRNRSIANARDDVSSPTGEDRYKGLTPPISPAQGRMSSPYQLQPAHASLGQAEQSYPRPQQSRGSVAGGSDTSRRPSSHRDSERSSSAAGTWGFSGDGGRGEGVDFPSEGGGGGSRADRCPSRQGGTRTGPRATSGSRLGREQRQLHQNASSSGLGEDRVAAPEDSLHHQLAEAGASNGYAASFVTDVSGEATKPADAPGGGGDRTRVKSRRRKVRAPMGGSGGGEEEAGAMAEWGDSGVKKERRSKNEGRARNEADAIEGGGAEGDATGCPSILDSALWKGGREGDERDRGGGGRGVTPSESGVDIGR